MFRHILIPTDGSDLSTQTVAKALDFARDIGAEVTVLSVMEPLQVFTVYPAGLELAFEEYEKQSNETADTMLAGVKAKAAERLVACDTVKLESMDPAGTIVDVAEKYDCDLIAMASHGRSGFKAFMLGSVTIKVLASSKIPVIVYR